MAEIDAKNKGSSMDDLKKSSIDTVKQLAPWRASLPWWVVLVEGIVLALVGLLILIDPRRSTINIALFLAAAMLVAGILQLWSVLRGKVPENVDALVAARGAVAVFAGAMVLLLRFLDYMNLESGLLIFGLGSLIFGVAGLTVAFIGKRGRRVSSFVEGFFFSLFGILLLYILIVGEVGSRQVQTVTQVVAWTAIIGGLGLVGLSFFNKSRQSSEREDSAITGAKPVVTDDEDQESAWSTESERESAVDSAAIAESTPETKSRIGTTTSEEPTTDEEKPKGVL